ncbi:DUF397 domain-containing protein [Actinomadura sp. KC345]|uniref:DUF397 domain-containing protein n=1 Tax=Actinomadura sp. KC345 TaxID=2530371 RepID=UPI001049BA42|nr:DUF397 domain-containing protein [Actinomadura sp. KC345]TDC44863.1 DUF397 domain-containing protein [Actinomadura sp. KC345]
MPRCAPKWCKSSYSQTHGTSDCVELASLDGVVGIRDSKSLSTPHLSVSKEGMAALFDRIKAGGLDLLTGPGAIH